ncbi:hypothetical protein LguiA_014275 [Lonicera macranthoides]
MRVFLDESTNTDIKSNRIVPFGHQLERDKRASFSCGHEFVEIENACEFVEVDHESIELEVSGSGFQTGSGCGGGFLFPSNLGGGIEGAEEWWVRI